MQTTATITASSSRTQVPGWTEVGETMAKVEEAQQLRASSKSCSFSSGTCRNSRSSRHWKRSVTKRSRRWVQGVGAGVDLGVGVICFL